LLTIYPPTTALIIFCLVCLYQTSFYRSYSSFRSWPYHQSHESSTSHLSHSSRLLCYSWYSFYSSSTSFILVWYLFYWSLSDQILFTIPFFLCQLWNSKSSVFQLLFGVPQGSDLSPLLFVFYATPLSTVISSSAANHHLYDDDIQILILFWALDFSRNITHLEITVSNVSNWMSANILSLNHSRDTCSCDSMIHNWWKSLELFKRYGMFSIFKRAAYFLWKWRNAHPLYERCPFTHFHIFTFNIQIIWFSSLYFCKTRMYI